MLGCLTQAYVVVGPRSVSIFWKLRQGFPQMSAVFA
jgi:hypothetical protein